MFTLLALHGETIPKYLRCKMVDEEALLAALREHGVGDLNSVEMAVLETDGSISVVPLGEPAWRGKKIVKNLCQS
jgi:uncharacterized membrane protein YcaP (DUF421 family)